MSISAPTLPYALDALEPHVSERTLDYHFGKHHQGYVDTLNDLIEDSEYAGMDLADIVVKARDESDNAILTNAAQAWNHAFLWESMSPVAESAPQGQLQTLLEDAFDTLDRFKSEFREAATGVTGSGWVWLVRDTDGLKILTTANAGTVVGTSLKPLLVLDVWEHAYYLDYQNERAGYVDAFLNKLINWTFAADNLEAAANIQAA